MSQLREREEGGREGGEGESVNAIIHESTTVFNVLVFLQISPRSLLRLSSAHRLN